MPKKDTHRIGDQSEAMAIARLTRIYDAVLIPFGNGKRYDLVVEKDGVFIRIQVKTGRLRYGTVIFNRDGGRSYAGQVDKFAVYCPQTNQVYLIDESETRHGVSFRVEPLKNKAEKRVFRWAHDYEI
jgi:PD-(D/E)XK endonuclease